MRPLRSSLSTRDLKEMLRERGLALDHTTRFWCVPCYASELDRRGPPPLKTKTESGTGRGTLNIGQSCLDASASRCRFRREPPGVPTQPNARCASIPAFFPQDHDASHTTHRDITVDKHAAFPKALTEPNSTGSEPAACELQQGRDLNTVVEQEKQFIKRLVELGLGYFAFETGWRTVNGKENLNALRMGQMRGGANRNSRSQVEFITRLFG